MNWNDDQNAEHFGVTEAPPARKNAGGDAWRRGNAAFFLRKAKLAAARQERNAIRSRNYARAAAGIPLDLPKLKPLGFIKPKKGAL